MLHIKSLHFVQTDGS